MTIAGALLLCGGIITGGSITSIATSFQGEPLEEGAVPLAEVPSDQIKAVELNLIRSDISFAVGDNFDVSGTGNFDSYVKDGILYAGASSRKYTLKVLGMNLSLPSKWLCGHASYVITLPRKLTLDSIKINTSFSDITGDSLKADTIDINCTHGDFSMALLSAGHLKLNTTGGSISLGELYLEEEGAISGSRDITLGPGQNNNDMHNITVNSDRGDLQFAGKVEGDSSFTTSRGDIHLTLPGTEKNYTLTSPEENLTIGSAAPASDNQTPEHYGNITFNCGHGEAAADFTPQSSDPKKK